MTHPAFAHTAHRPWPLPKAAWEWRQSWRDLLFAHWLVPVEAVRPLVPAALDIDTFDGQTYVGIVPFRMAGVMRRPLPDLPYVSAFPEINVRVYVVAKGKPGVWFLSLDATNRVAVAAARTLFHLPYYRAQMDVIPDGDGIDYRSFRLDKTHGKQRSASLVGSYRPTSPVYSAEPGTLEHWLMERYCLYAQHPNGAIFRTEVHHKQWPLQQATADFLVNTISVAGGLPVSGPPATLHFSRRIDVVVWGPDWVRQTSEVSENL